MPQEEIRPALYHRFHRLLPFFAHPVARRVWRLALWGFWLIYFGFVLLVLALRYSVLPNIENYRTDIEQLATQGLGQAVSIGRIEASWSGIHPDLTLLDVRIADAQGRPALAFSRIETVLSWWSVPSLQLKLRLLQINEPILHLRREPDGRFFVAGIPVDTQGSDSGVGDWVLGLKRLRIHGATLVWEDALRNAPPLVLEDLNFGLDNNGHHHRFGLTALPEPGLASKIDVRGDFSGSSFEQLDAWKGKLFAEIDYADLAVWRRWVDYPVALPHGRGALRTWVSMADGALREVTADVSLADVSLQLAKSLPPIELDSMSGRLAVKLAEKGAGFDVSGRQIALVVRPLAGREGGGHAPGQPIHIAPVDFRVDWQPDQSDSEAKTVRGSATASRVDLGVFADLSAHFPLDAQSRKLLRDFAPQGQISELRAGWRGDAERLQTYSVKGRFDDLALKAQGYFPGFSGLSGTLDANEQGGSATLRSQKSTLDLPSILPESLIPLDTLSAQAKWKIRNGVLDAELSRVEFAGPEAAGSAQGTYRHSGEGPGNIDLTATLTRGDARAVWRYMPHAVNANARHWVRDALTAGRASEAKLVLKGDLAHFPFVDKKQGQFLVTVKAQDVTVDYAKSWPKITGIDGDLRFEGAGMVVDVQQGALLGAQLAHTHAEIPDFDAPLTMLNVKGRAEGATAEFLKFIEQSPVSDRIDHFTDDMRASGNGRLELNLTIPLEEARLGDSKIDGTYHFVANEVTVDPGLPPLRQVNGTLRFSEKDVQIPGVDATLFGGPLKIQGATQADGKVLINATGSLSVAQLRKQADLPLFDKLSGAVSYRGEVRVKKRSADLTIDSSLVGLSSSLPEPFNKNTADTMALHFEKTMLPSVTPRSGQPVVRDQMRAALGNAMSLQIIRRKQAEGFVPERGAIAVGRPLQLPERGVLLGVSSKRLDLDYWRKLFSASTTSATNSLSKANPKPVVAVTETAAPSMISAINIKAGELQLLGSRLSDVDLSASSTAEAWQMHLVSREANGDLQWEGAGRGKLTARLKQVLIDPAAVGRDVPAPGDVIAELPALDIVADDFAIGKRRFGRLELQARNETGLWRLDKIQISNPYGSLTGSGRWQVADGNRTTLDFKMDSNDVGKFLDRLGYPGAVRAGNAQMAGKIGWLGSPAGLDYATLTGEMALDAARGQFVKLDPGAGKLLGLISLQSLPRRITLDFRDVFSEGFAFDSISGKLIMQNGMMRTDRLQIDGPAARIVMRGETDLQHETQRLEVNVQPELGGSAALGVALINPLAGVAALLAHKILQNPLNQIFGFDYLVTGTWDDPKVDKIVRTVPSPSTGTTTPPAPRLPNLSTPPGAPANDAPKQ
jgi:uncharacterized protein (TIGR02099 family)